MAEGSGEDDTSSSDSQDTNDDPEYKVPSESSSDSSDDGTDTSSQDETDATSEEKNDSSEEKSDSSEDKNDASSQDKAPCNKKNTKLSEFETLESNKPIPNGKIRSYKCSKCNIVLQSLTYFAMHTKVHTDGEETCAKQSSETKTLKSKKTSKRGQPQKAKYQCFICNMVFQNKQLLEMHAESHADEKGRPSKAKHQCSICNVFFQSRHFLEMHSENHADEKKVTNKINSMTSFTDETSIHKLTKCPKCYIFVKKKELPEHMQSHYEKRLFNCPKCKESFVNLTDLELHRKNNATPNNFCIPNDAYSIKFGGGDPANRKYECRDCYTLFYHWLDFIDHLEDCGTQEEARNIKCSKCNGDFSGMSDFNSHVCKKNIVKKYNIKVDSKIDIQKILQDPMKKKAFLSRIASVVGQNHQLNKSSESEQYRNQSRASSTQNGTKVMRLNENWIDVPTNEIAVPLEDPLRITPDDSSDAEFTNSTIQDSSAGRMNFKVKNEKLSWDEGMSTDEFVQQNESEENFSTISSNFTTCITGQDTDDFFDVKEHKVDIKIEKFD